MASKTLIVLVLHCCPLFLAATAQGIRSSNLTLDSSLSPNGNSYLLSPSGLFAFGFLPIANVSTIFSIAIWYAGSAQVHPLDTAPTVVWTAYRDEPPASINDTLVVTVDRGLIWQQYSGGQDKSISADLIEPVAVLSLLDSGNLVLYNSDNKILWQSFQYPTDTLLPGQVLQVSSELTSSISEGNHSSGKYRIKMQKDANLVMYPVGTQDTGFSAYWASNTTSFGSNVALTLDDNGWLYMFNISSGRALKNLTDGDQTGRFGAALNSNRDIIYRATMDSNGMFRLYYRNLSRQDVWLPKSWIPDNTCYPRGVCGGNGYCVLTARQQPSCVCLEGFVFIDNDQRNLGCVRNISVNYSAKGCINGSTIHEVEGVGWEDSAYSVLSSMNKDECRQACLEDCNCEVALFGNQECRMQKIPMRFGRIETQESSYLTLVKVNVGNFASTNNISASGRGKKVGQHMGVLFTGIACLSFSLFIILMFSAFVFHRNHSSAEVFSGSRDGKLVVDEALNLRSFTYKDLDVATNGFAEQLGRGSFGTVFKGTLPKGNRAIAVKRLEKVASEGEEEFQNEMRSIGKTHHKNLLRLLGYCHEGSNRLLVYDYMSNGSLTSFLLNSQTKPRWDERVAIALGVARGILYLHEECENQIIHCDINPNNILIGQDHSAKIADFGLAKLLMPDQTRTITRVRGTRGYVAPEWNKNSPITVKADVYSFGVVLLVIVCCRRSIDLNVPESEIILPDWVKECFKADNLRNLVPDEEVVDEQELERVVRIGLWCIQEEPTIRPTMKKVVAMFEGLAYIPAPPGCSSESS